MQLEENVAAAMCERSDKDDALALASFFKVAFTVGALDNLDHYSCFSAKLGSG